jgi:Bacterial extracellular solute-binding proteins, family 5 Middle
VLCSLVLLASCTGSSDDADGGPTLTPTAVEPSEPSGEVVFGVLGEPATLDPYSPLASDLTYALARPLYPSLFRLLPDGTAAPYLAGSVQELDGGVRVNLRAARWSDGSLITAQDVAASARRARLPSGFAVARSVRAVGSTAVEFRGPDVDWPVALASGAFIMPGGRYGSVVGGPFQIESRTPGLEVVLEPNTSWVEGAVGVERLRIQFIENTGTMTYLLKEGRLDAAAIPSAVNLGFRLEEAGLEHDSALGWESVRLDFAAGDLGQQDRKALTAAIERDVLQDGFVRDDGRISNTLTPQPGDGGADGDWEKPKTSQARLAGRTFGIAAPVGDELLNSLQQVIQLQLDDRDALADMIDIDVRTFYGRRSSRGPADAFLARSLGAPELPEPRLDGSLGAMPMFQVATYLAWNDGVEGPEVNPSIEGALWNAATWTAQPD